MLFRLGHLRHSLLCLSLVQVAYSQTISGTTQQPLRAEDRVQNAESTVVQITVRIDPFYEDKPGTSRPSDFPDSNYLIEGTGFIVSNEGDVITADHVIANARVRISELKADNIPAELVICVPTPQLESKQVEISGSSIDYKLAIKAEDEPHDIALVSGQEENPPHTGRGRYCLSRRVRRMEKRSWPLGFPSVPRTS
jgi:hypothetical protein